MANKNDDNQKKSGYFEKKRPAGTLASETAKDEETRQVKDPGAELLRLKKELEAKKHLLEKKLKALEIMEESPAPKIEIKNRISSANVSRKRPQEAERPKVEITSKLDVKPFEAEKDETKRGDFNNKRLLKQSLKNIKAHENDAEKPKLVVKSEREKQSDSEQKLPDVADFELEISPELIITKKIDDPDDVDLSEGDSDEKPHDHVEIEEKQEARDRPKVTIVSNVKNSASSLNENGGDQQIGRGLTSQPVSTVTDGDDRPKVTITKRFDNSFVESNQISEKRKDSDKPHATDYEKHMARKFKRLQSEKGHQIGGSHDKIKGEYASQLDDHIDQRPMLKKKSDKKAKYDDKALIKNVVQSEVGVKSIVEQSNREGGSLHTKNQLPSLKKDTEKTRIFRHELKYYISWADYKMLSRSMNLLLKHDEHANENGDYHIRSLYFDDAINTALVEKLSGIENRKKYRIRVYGLKDNFIRLERKNKTKDFISKDNLTLTRKEYDDIINGDIRFLLKKENQLAKDFYYEIKTKKLEPTVIVDYIREAYIHPIKNLRITFDKMVKSGRYATSIFNEDVALTTVLPAGTIVLEVKFEKGLPDYIIGVLNTVSACQRSAISKYALCRKYES
jgi:hypothetical protein